MYSKGMAKQRKEWKSSAQKCKGAVQRSLVEWREATVLQGYVMRGTVMFSSENQWHLDESKRDGLAWSRAAKALRGLALGREAMAMHREAGRGQGTQWFCTALNRNGVT